MYLCQRRLVMRKILSSSIPLLNNFLFTYKNPRKERANSPSLFCVIVLLTFITLTINIFINKMMYLKTIMILKYNN